MKIGDVDLSVPRIVGVVSTIDEVINAERAGADLLEIRIDLLDRTENVDQFFKDVHLSSPLPVIATNRWSKEGGSFTGSEEERISMLLSAMEHSDAVDIELRAAERNVVTEGAKKQGMPSIISYHDFDKTPPKEQMMRMLEEARGAGDIPKLAVMANSLGDVLKLLEVTLLAQKPLCTIAMGALGVHSRIIAPLYGSALTYGHAGRAKAPGQLSVSELRNTLDVLLRR
ncbi:MAG: type I 3-dehydroquinate dehydratase [Methanocellales archaeon]|nr:type I 3-dehydroquinate dehydratase [Methanocellales archaeon]